MTFEYCRTCRMTRHFAILEGTLTAPDFNCCQYCGGGYCVTPETTTEEIA